MSDDDFVIDPATGCAMSREAFERREKQRAAKEPAAAESTTEGMEAAVAYAGGDASKCEVTRYFTGTVRLKGEPPEQCTVTYHGPDGTSETRVFRAAGDGADEVEVRDASPALPTMAAYDAEGRPVAYTAELIMGVMGGEHRDVPVEDDAEPPSWREEVHAMLRAGKSPAEVLAAWPNWELPDDVAQILKEKTGCWREPPEPAPVVMTGTLAPPPPKVCFGETTYTLPKEAPDGAFYVFQRVEGRWRLVE